MLLCETHSLMMLKANMNSKRQKVKKLSGQFRGKPKVAIRHSFHAVFGSRFHINLQNGINHYKWEKPDTGI